MGVFGPRNPLFQKMGMRGLSGVGGIPTLHFATLLASYRIGFGLPGRNRTKIGKNRKRPPPENRKNSRKIGKLAPKPFFSVIFPILPLFFSYFLAEAVFSMFFSAFFFFLFRAGGPKTYSVAGQRGLNTASSVECFVRLFRSCGCRSCVAPLAATVTHVQQIKDHPHPQ